MKKELIDVANLDKYICKKDGKFYLGKNILTPSAKDELAKRGVGIVYGQELPSEEAAPCCCQEQVQPNAQAKACDAAAPKSSDEENLEELVIAVGALLKKQYGDMEPAKLRAMTIEALQSVLK